MTSTRLPLAFLLCAAGFALGQEQAQPLVADATLRRLAPNQNQGADTTLRLSRVGKNRAALRVDAAALAQALAGGSVTAASLELTIADLDGDWDSGRAVELHRLRQAWSEGEVTWNRATSASEWSMLAVDPDDLAYDPTPVASATIANGQAGVLALDVTAEVQALLSGQANLGWLLKKADEGQPGRVDFGSRDRRSCG